MPPLLTDCERLTRLISTITAFSADDSNGTKDHGWLGSAQNNAFDNTACFSNWQDLFAYCLILRKHQETVQCHQDDVDMTLSWNLHTVHYP